MNQRGMTDITNLYAIGETSFTGLHGANRMASNSLLECFVIAFAAAQDIAGRFDATPLEINLPHWDASRVVDSDDEILVSHNWDELRRCMWDFVGIVRNDERLLNTFEPKNDQKFATAHKTRHCLLNNAGYST